jgi:hypothetical protein
MPFNEKMLFLEAVFFLFFSKVFLFLPFKFCVSKVKNNDNEVYLTRAELKKVRNAVRRADKLSFWKNICLVKSFAARFMLLRRNVHSKMYLGLEFKDSKELLAHAWLVSNEFQVTPKGNKKYKEIFNF